MEEKLTKYDPAYLALAIGIVAKIKGIKEIAKETGLSVEQIYKSLNEHGNHTLETARAVLNEANVRAGRQNSQSQALRQEHPLATITQ